MRIAYFCFITAAASALIGMGLGIRMGMSSDFTLAPVHAHINLLGWVTMSLFGLYYRGSGQPESLVRWIQAGGAATGFPMLTGGLAYFLSTGSHAGKPFILAGSLLTFSAMALFLAILVADALRSRRAASLPEALPVPA